MGQGVEIENGYLINTNPATGQILSKVKCSTKEEINEMIVQANIAQKTIWRLKSLQERMNLLKEALEIIAQPELCQKLETWMVQEMGKPIAEAKEEMEFATQKQVFLKLLEESLQPQTFGSGSDGKTKSIVTRHPFGVAVILSPWNFPVDEVLLLALPSLASGNTVIVKPSEVVPETGALLIQSLQSVLPPNVLQLAQGAGSVGEQLVSHPDTHLIAMTGSSATGQRILQSAASHKTQMKRVVLEMGGKDPMLVMEDADLEKAAQDAVQYSLCNTGQVCCAVERIYVAETIYEQFQEAVTKYATENFVVGNGMDPKHNVGPLVSTLQRDQVKEQVENAIENGAKVLYQSPVPSTEQENNLTSFYPITVLANVTHEMQLFQKETFGPVVAMTKFDGTEMEAIKLANQTEYGLSSMVYTKDLEKAQRIASLIDAGQVGINCYPLDHLDVNCPWVGHKNSGFGYHSGIDGYHQFSIPKSIVVHSE